METKELLGDGRKVWANLVKVAAWLAMAVAAFVLPPPVWDPKEDKSVYWFGRFALAVITGLLLVFMNRPGAKRFNLWWVAAIILAISSTVLFFSYEYYRGTRSVVFHGQRVVIGNSMIKEARDDQAKNPQFDIERLIEYRGGIGDVWPPLEIQQNRLHFGELYLALLTSSATTILLTIQTLVCMRQPERI